MGSWDGREPDVLHLPGGRPCPALENMRSCKPGASVSEGEFRGRSERKAGLRSLEADLPSAPGPLWARGVEPKAMWASSRLMRKELGWLLEEERAGFPGSPAVRSAGKSPETPLRPAGSLPRSEAGSDLCEGPWGPQLQDCGPLDVFLLSEHSRQFCFRRWPRPRLESHTQRCCHSSERQIACLNDFPHRKMGSYL